MLLQFLVNSRNLLSLFFSSLAFGGFYSLFLFIIAQLHACVVCIAHPADLAVVHTQGFYFVSVIAVLKLGVLGQDYVL